jgi:hypothetical protein
MLFYTLVKSFITISLICYANVMKNSATISALTLKFSLVKGTLI